jgi:hypothetical protein
MANKYLEFSLQIKRAQDNFQSQEKNKAVQRFEALYDRVRELCLQAANSGQDFIDIEDEITDEDVKGFAQRYIKLNLFSRPVDPTNAVYRWKFQSTANFDFD